MRGIERLKELRIEAGMSQTELASVLKISQQAIYKYENGLAEPDIAKLVEIAYFFGVSVDYLIGNSDAKIVSDTKLDRIISLSGLDNDDIEVIQNLICFLRKKNRKTC